MAPKLASTTLASLQKEYKEIAKFALNERAQAEDDADDDVDFEEPLQANTLLEFATALTQRVMREDAGLSYATRSALENFVRGHSIPAHPSEPAWKRFEALQAAEAASADKRAFIRNARDLVIEALASLPDGPAAGGSSGTGAGGSKGGGKGAGGGKGVSLPAIKTLVEEDWEAQGGTGFDAGKVTAVLKALVLKGVVVQVGGRYHLAKGKDKPKAAAATAAASKPKAAAASPADKPKAAAARKPAAKPVAKAATKAAASPKAAGYTPSRAVARKNPLPGPSSPAAAKPAVSKSPAYKAPEAAAAAKPAAGGRAAAKAAAKPRSGRAAGAGAAAAPKGRGATAAAGGVKKAATKKAAPKPRATKSAAAAGSADTAGEAAEPPAVVDGKPMWKIEKFVSLRKGRGRGKRLLRVRWQGWSADDDSWLPEKQLVEDLGAQGFAELLEELEEAGGVRGKATKPVKGGRGSKAGAVKGGGVQKRAGAGAKRGAAVAGGRGKK